MISCSLSPQHKALNKQRLHSRPEGMRSFFELPTVTHLPLAVIFSNEIVVESHDFNRWRLTLLNKYDRNLKWILITFDYISVNWWMRKRWGGIGRTLGGRHVNGTWSALNGPVWSTSLAAVRRRVSALCWPWQKFKRIQYPTALPRRFIDLFQLWIRLNVISLNPFPMEF
jgi:hypothetical protein